MSKFSDLPREFIAVNPSNGIDECASCFYEGMCKEHARWLAQEVAQITGMGYRASLNEIMRLWDALQISWHQPTPDEVMRALEAR